MKRRFVYRILGALMAGTMVISSIGCGSNTTENKTTNETADIETSEAEKTETSTEETEEQTAAEEKTATAEETDAEEATTAEETDASEETEAAEESGAAKENAAAEEKTTAEETEAAEETGAAKETETAEETTETVSAKTEPDNEIEEQKASAADTLTATQKNSINMLNYITVLSQEISDSKNSKLYLEEAYSSIVNNTYPNAVDDRTLGELNSLLDTLEQYRMTAAKRERLEYIYEQNQAQTMREALPNAMGLLSAVQSRSLAKLVASVAYMAIDSVTSYQSASAEADMEYLQEGWALDDEEAETLHRQREETFSYMIKTVNENQLPGELALTEDTVDTFVEWKDNDNVISRIRFLESNKATYMAFGGYWLTLAKSYYENGDYEKCLSAIESYEKLDISIFRKDYDYAEILALAIAAAEETLSGEEYISAAGTYAEKILDNTENDQWSLRYIAAQTYAALYGKTDETDYLEKAYDIALDNVNSMVSKQRTLNETYLKEIETVKADKDASSETKKEIKQYNKMLKEDRKTELAPVYEPLLLNADLLFAIAGELEISDADKEQIDQILHKNGEELFLIQGLDQVYRFEDTEINTEEIEISFEGDKLTIPAKYIGKDSTITVTVQGEDTVIDDWKITKVSRKEEGNIDTFKAVYTSKTAEKLDFKEGMKITVEIDVRPDSDVQELIFEYTVDAESHWGPLPDGIQFQRSDV